MLGVDGNPFSSGHVRLIGRDNATVLQATRISSNPDWMDVLIMPGTNPEDFTTENFMGSPPDGSPNTDLYLVGTAGEDTLNGRFGNDVINGADGNDVLQGFFGRDALDGELGDDQLFGGDGNDVLRGGDGTDFLVGDDGNDILYGDDGNDELYGGDGYDVLIGGAGNDTLIATSNDKVFGGLGDDHISTGGGADAIVTIIRGEEGNDVLDLSNGVSIIAYGGTGDDRIFLGGNIGEVSAQGDEGNDWFLIAKTGGNGKRYAHGGAGDDHFMIKSGGILNGGEGADVFEILGWWWNTATTIKGFETGPGGDTLDISSVYEGYGPRSGTNPFETGYLRLIQIGDDTSLQYKRSSGSQYVTKIKFVGVSPEDVMQNIVGLPEADEAPADAEIALIGTEPDAWDAFVIEDHPNAPSFMDGRGGFMDHHDLLC